MMLSIENTRLASSNEWDEIWRKCDYSTYFHSREWSEIWNLYTKGRMKPDPKLIEFSDGKKAILPLSSQKNYKGLITNYITSPAGTYGGWISNEELDTSHAILLTNYLTQKFSNLMWRLNPYDHLVFQTGVKISKDDETHTLNLVCGFDAIYKRWTKGHRYAARKAGNEGIRVKISSSIDDWYTYYQVYENSLTRWGNKATSSYGWDLFNFIFQRHSSNIKLWLALYQDKIVAGALCFYAKKHVVYWHGAALKDYFHLYPVNLIISEAIKDAIENGYSWFDFNPSGGHEGVKNFKKNFGCSVLKSDVYLSDSNTTKLVHFMTNLLSK